MSDKASKCDVKWYKSDKIKILPKCIFEIYITNVWLVNELRLKNELSVKLIIFWAGAQNFL